MSNTPAKPGRREQNRISRTRLILDTAFTIVTQEGFDALTMQRLADQTDAAIGAVYRYFPSKSALVAEVQRAAIDRLASSYTLIRDRGERAFGVIGDEILIATARLVLLGRWFVATADSYPQEMRLLQMLMSESRMVMSVEDGLRVVPSAMQLLDEARVAVAMATEVGALDDREDPMSRVVTWAAAIGGVLQLSRLGVYDAELFDGDRLARAATADLFVGWGAPRARVDAADELVEALRRDGPLAPAIPRPPAS
jgi:AcrR family transcriptional regulator